jgi:hypothetical protein
MSVSYERQAQEAPDDLEMVSLPPIDVEDSGADRRGSLQGILTGVIAGGSRP